MMEQPLIWIVLSLAALALIEGGRSTHAATDMLGRSAHVGHAHAHAQTAVKVVPLMPAGISNWLTQFEPLHRMRECPVDATFTLPSRPRRLFLAANFYNSEHILPNFMVQVGEQCVVARQS